MIIPRVIPVLSLVQRRLVKTTKFNDAQYVGDPVNTVRIFNDKEVDELIVSDIRASINGTAPQYDLIEQVASEAFMPVCYGGGIQTLEIVKRILSLGIEKVCMNTSAVERPDFISEVAGYAGSQSVVVSIDVKRNIWGTYKVCSRSGSMSHNIDLVEFAQLAEHKGAGELLINSIDRDGTMSGYDVALVAKISKAVNIPVIALGGAALPGDLVKAVREGHASAVAAGSMFVYYGRHKAVLINYPDRIVLENIFSEPSS